MLKDSENKRPLQNTMISFAKDLPNICSLTGLLCAVLGIYFAIMGNFPAAIIGMIWAVLFDWGDGIIARCIKGRSDKHQAFGEQLDSLIDLVSFGILPAIILLSYGKFSIWFLPGAFIIIASCVIRLSYFNVFGLIDDSTYMGLALDNNALFLAFIFLFNNFFEQIFFSYILYILCVFLSILNLAPIRTYKFTGKKWFYILLFYILILSAIYIQEV